MFFSLSMNITSIHEYGCMGQIYNDHKQFKRICEFYHGACNVSVNSLKVLDNTSLTINKIGLYV